MRFFLNVHVLLALLSAHHVLCLNIRNQTAKNLGVEALGKQDDVCDGVQYLKKAYGHPGGLPLAFRRRSAPVRIVDFIQIGNTFELPLLLLRLAEMGAEVDEIHIAEGDRDFSGHSKQYVLPGMLAGSAELGRWRSKITHHPVQVPTHLTGYDIQKQVIAAKHNIKGYGVMLEGDLDEIISRPVLRAFRHCEPSGSNLDAKVTMDVFYYSLDWYRGDWALPTIAHDIPSSSSHVALSRDHGDSEREFQKEENRSKYIFDRPDRVVGLGGRAGWHMSWMLGPEGLANKLLRGRIEATPDWALPYIHDKDALVDFLRHRFLPNPQPYDHGLQRTHLTINDIPQAMREDPHKYKDLLGSYFPLALKAAPYQ